MRAFKLIVLMAVAILLGLEASAQTLTVEKSGNDVVLSWTGGTGPFMAFKARCARMSCRRVIVANPATSPTADTGAAVDGVKIWFYQVTPAGPTITVTTPTANFESAVPCVSASGTAPSAVAVYVNGYSATLDGSSWSLAAVPLAVGGDPLQANLTPVTVTAVDASGNWSFTVIDGTYTGTTSTSKHNCITRTWGFK